MLSVESTLNQFLGEPRIAYFSMEIALQEGIPTYSGGLGILAGDVLRSAADLDLPMVAVTLVSRSGYFRQEIDAQGNQIEHPDSWEPQQWCRALPAQIAVEIEGRDVWVRSWLYVMESPMGGRKPIILLDTMCDANSEADRLITSELYGGDPTYRFKQEIVLGIGGVRMLHALGFDVSEYHMNEGHSALLGLELLHRFRRSARQLHANESIYDVPRVRSKCNFTTHTPVEAAHDKIPMNIVKQVLGNFIDDALLEDLGGTGALNMTRLAFNLSEFVNGVAKRHAEVSSHLFPGYRIQAITNGVHPCTWTGKEFVRLYDHYIPGWRFESELLIRVDQIPDGLIWEAHQLQKKTLMELVNQRCDGILDPDLPTIGFARRMTPYKRPDMLFTDIEKLKHIAHHYPFQLVMAGKAHPRDQGGRQLIRDVHRHIQELKGLIPIVYIPNYDMTVAKHLVGGVDIWLNNPLRPLEASGTSGMKAAFNGVPNFSVLDGWWIEGCIEGVTGWSIGDKSDSSNGNDAESLYQKLESTVLPMYHNNRNAWITVMKGAIGKNASYFNSHRMMRRYFSEAYLR